MIAALANIYPFAPGEVVGPHASQSVMTVVCLRGVGILDLPSGSCPLATGDVLRLELGTPRRYRADARDPFVLIGVHATAQPGLPVHAAALPLPYGGEAAGLRRHDASGHLRAAAERLCAVFAERPSAGRGALLAAQLAVLDAEWERLAEAPVPDGRLGAVASWLRLSFNRPITRAEMARRAGLAESTFAAAFRATYGVPPLRYLNDLRLERARDLLASSGASIEEVAAACGFNDLPWFSRNFRRRYGMTPSAWRRERRRL